MEHSRGSAGVGDRTYFRRRISRAISSGPGLPGSWGSLPPSDQDEMWEKEPAPCLLSEALGFSAYQSGRNRSLNWQKG